MLALSSWFFVMIFGDFLPAFLILIMIIIFIFFFFFLPLGEGCVERADEGAGQILSKLCFECGELHDFAVNSS